ncbi:MAG: hypothetical protein JF616_18795 [Fibrobacteres bacterium]|nr:hypothetical protein [Fibrobacterota bacterium]
MLRIAVFVFAVAALGGLVLAVRHFKGQDRPWPLAILHGLLGAAGLILLLLPVLTGGVPALAKTALALFVAAALGGFTLFAFHLQKKPLPSLVVIIHAGVAVIAFILLATAVFT